MQANTKNINKLKRSWPVEKRDYNSLPLAAWPDSRNVFGYFPSPQTLKDPKSLNQRPSGTLGFEFYPEA
jgi:hypothetical protein